MFLLRNRASACLLLLLVASGLQAQKFYPDDPLWEEPEILIPEPAGREEGILAEALGNTYLKRPDDDEPIPEAKNINSLGEVPDSSWFTNRIGRHAMALEDLKRGPAQSGGPGLSRPLRVISAKSEGAALGFVAKDARDDTYFIKLDPRGYFQVMTSSSVIANNFHYAFGYHVPEEYLLTITPAELEIDPEAENPEELDRVVKAVLENAASQDDGKYQLLASLSIPGKILGPSKYFGTQSDDPNAVIPHQDRRELRGLRLFSAWLNNSDTKAGNTMETFMVEEGRETGRVVHYLLDFGSSLGSAGRGAKPKRYGHEYVTEMGPAAKTALTLGLWERPWRSIEFKSYPVSGQLEADFFQPADWKSNFPNPAFDRMLKEDAFWAAKIIMKFSEEMIRALVETGRIVDPEDENYLVETLLKRQKKIVDHYLSLLNPLDEFQIREGRLEFQNLGVQAGLGTVQSYQFEWYRLDNPTGRIEPVAHGGTSSHPSLEIPDVGGHAGQPADFLMVRIRTSSPSQPEWLRPVDVYLRHGNEVVGIERPEDF